MLEKLAKLINVKSIVTLALTIVVAILALKGRSGPRARRR